jgi:hypothetical protein
MYSEIYFTKDIYGLRKFIKLYSQKECTKD